MHRLATTVAATLFAAAIPLYAGPAAAAPLSQPQSLKSANVSAVDQVQYRRWRSGRWIGPGAAAFAAGSLVGGALAAGAYNSGYYAYGAAPGYYAYGAVPSPGYTGPQYYWGYGAEAPAPGSSAACTPDRDDNSAFPSWMCR